MRRTNCDDEALQPVTFTPIGVVRTPFVEKASAPRQPSETHPVSGVIELTPGRDFEHALEDLDGWQYIWVIFCFHLNEGWRPKVLPPRSTEKRGLFATRAPHRPNPIGISVVELTGIEGLDVHVRGVDMMDGTPVLDIKPYVPYADSRPAARTGWLDSLVPPPMSSPKDPDEGFDVRFDALARAQLDFLAGEGQNLEDPLKRALGLGPQPHPYRRIKREGDGFRIAMKEWRAKFRVEGRIVVVESIASGYRARELVTRDDLDVHRAFVAKFGA